MAAIVRAPAEAHGDETEERREGLGDDGRGTGHVGSGQEAGKGEENPGRSEDAEEGDELGRVHGALAQALALGQARCRRRGGRRRRSWRPGVARAPAAGPGWLSCGGF